jgi:hypothetical protein
MQDGIARAQRISGIAPLIVRKPPGFGISVQELERVATHPQRIVAITV